MPSPGYFYTHPFFGLTYVGPQMTTNTTAPSWYCDQCHVEVYDRRCPHCGKTEREPS